MTNTDEDDFPDDDAVQEQFENSIPVEGNLRSSACLTRDRIRTFIKLIIRVRS